MRGWLHELAGEYPASFADYLVDARRSDLDAQHQVGKMLLLGKPGIAKDPRRAAHWIAEAAYRGEAEGRQALRKDPVMLAEIARQPIEDLADQ